MEIIGDPKDIFDPSRPIDLDRGQFVLPILSRNQYSPTESGKPSELQRAYSFVQRLLEEISFAVRRYRRFREGGRSCIRMMNEPQRRILADVAIPRLLDLNNQPNRIIENIRNAVLYANNDMDLALVFTPYLRPANEIERNFEQVVGRIRGLVAMCYDDCRDCPIREE